MIYHLSLTLKKYRKIYTHTKKKKKKGCTFLLIVAPPLFILKRVAEGVFNAAHYTRTIYHGFN